MPNKLKKVYELEGLVCDLHAHFTAASGSTLGISKSKATELLSSTIFDYEPNSRYVWTYCSVLIRVFATFGLNCRQTSNGVTSIQKMRFGWLR